MTQARSTPNGSRVNVKWSTIISGVGLIGVIVASHFTTKIEAREELTEHKEEAVKRFHKIETNQKLMQRDITAIRKAVDPAYRREAERAEREVLRTVPALEPPS